MNKNENYSQPPGWRVALSIGIGVGWLVFVIIWLAFYAHEHVLYKNIAIILISILIVFIILGIPWAIWGLKNISKEGKRMIKTTGFNSRIIVSIIVPFVLFLFWIYWFYFPAENFDPYQNIAIFLVSILIVGGILGVLWSSWGMKYKNNFEKCGKESKEKIE
jgi:magnesium-transporting ATPase (P-type)